MSPRQPGGSSEASAKARFNSNCHPSNPSSSDSNSDDGFGPRKPAGYARNASEKKRIKKATRGRKDGSSSSPRPVKKKSKSKSPNHGYDEYGDYEDGDILDEEEGVGGEEGGKKRKRPAGRKETRISPLRIMTRDLSDSDVDVEDQGQLKMEVDPLLPSQPSKAAVPSASSGDTTEEEDSEDFDLEKDTYCDPVGSLAAMNMVDSEDEDLSIDPYEQEQGKEKALVGSKPIFETSPVASSTMVQASPSPLQRPPQSQPRPRPSAPPPLPITALPNLKVRPNFATTTEQDGTPPFVLEHGVKIGDPGIVVPQSINVHLRDYQRDGVSFLFDKWKQGRGGILGDDMGLGKTIQAIGFLTAIMKLDGTKRDKDRRSRWSDRMRDEGRMEEGLGRNNAKPSEKWPTCLIIAPASVCANWKRELETWTWASVGMYTSDEDKASILYQFKRGLFDIMIVGYEACRIGISDLWDLDFSVIIADEVHRAKNPSALISRAIRQFDCKVRLGLTGTAIQNRDDEFWCILDWCCPDALGNLLEWSDYITKPLRRAQSHDASPAEVFEGRIRAKQLVKFILPRFFLRRTKQLIAHQLPKKTDFVVICPQTAEQTRVINMLRSTENVQLLIKKDDPCDCGGPYGRGYCCYICNEDGVSWRNLILKYCTIFRKVANHLALLLPSDEDAPEQRALAKTMAAACFPTWNPQHLKLSVAVLDSAPELCGKWTMLKMLVDKWRMEDENHKILIFSMSTQLLKLIKVFLEHEAINFQSLTGADSMGSRMGIIDKFQTDPACFILLVSTLAGGVGLNLTAANKVVIFDPSWNPANDLQAMDRAFRIGQKRDVEVYRLILGGSIEEIIHERQLYKRAMANVGYTASLERRNFTGVMDDPERRGELFGLKNLFSQREDGLATADLNDRVFQAELKCRSESKDEEDGEARAVVGDRRLMEDDIEAMLDSFDGLDNPSEGRLPHPEILEIFAEAGATYFHEGDAPLGETDAEKEIFKQAKIIRKSNPAKASHIRAYDLLDDWERGASTRKSA
ncbi:P-loop containing nucleoside triphosphate hydrolase protein [Mrakia frigida]|uniref:DEAD/DEAH box helicase n=1 Tax=Mrakia frigida TaxID=29902 RepID=UPI003FCC11E4